MRRLILVLLLVYPLHGFAQVIWQDNCEQMSLEGWSYILNKQGISCSSEHKLVGQNATKVIIEGTDDYLWNNQASLNRVELQYAPDSVAEGQSTFFGWSFMLPNLRYNQPHEFGYWESNKHYQQIMRFTLDKNTLSFGPSNGKILWHYTSLKAEQWYDIAMHIHWSNSPQLGFVTIWFDGQKVVDRASMKTLKSAQELAFIQLGILRQQVDKQETIWLDNIRETRSQTSLLDTAIWQASAAQQ